MSSLRTLSQWSRAYFNPDVKFDLLVNNLTECFNSYILKARDKPIISMFEMIRKKLMKQYQLKRSSVEKYEGAICPKILEKLEAAGQESCHCLPTYAGQGLFEVEHRHQQFVVNLQLRSCGCQKWDLTGIPCPYAFSAILYDWGIPENYVHPWYSKDMYILSYAPIIYPMSDENQWRKTNYDVVQPPSVRIQPGRPKKLRKRGQDEPRNNDTRMTKTGTPMKCSECKELGHNKRTCPRRKAAMRRSHLRAPAAPFVEGESFASTDKLGPNELFSPPAASMLGPPSIEPSQSTQPEVQHKQKHKKKTGSSSQPSQSYMARTDSPVKASAPIPQSTMTASQPVPATRRAAPKLTVRRNYTSKPDSSIASRVHRRSARKAAEVGTMSSVGASQREREIVDLIIAENRPSQTSTHPISWCTPNTLWAKFGPSFMAAQQQTVGSSNGVVVPTINQAIQRVEERKKRKTAQKK